MTVDLTRRGFLKGLAGVVVIAALAPILHTPAPNIAEAVPVPTNVTPPDGLTYNWVRTSLLGEPDMENLQDRLDNGWTFVRPAAHPEMQTEDAAIAFERHGLILMQCPTAECELRRTYETWVKRAYINSQRHAVLFPDGYVVARDGTALAVDGTLFAGTMAEYHVQIAETWRQRAAAKAETVDA